MNKKKRKDNKLYIVMQPDYRMDIDSDGKLVTHPDGSSKWKVFGYIPKKSFRGPVAAYKSEVVAKRYIGNKPWHADLKDYPSWIMEIDPEDYIDKKKATLQEKILHAEKMVIKYANELKELEEQAKQEDSKNLDEQFKQAAMPKL